MLSIKEGVRLSGIRPEMAIALQVAASAYAEMGHDAIVTSVCEGQHGRGSRHFSGCAIDLRTRHVDADVQMILAKKVGAALGDDFDVVLESTHLHIEFDPKTGINQKQAST